MQIKKPTIVVTYDGKDITADISNDLVGFSYTDKVAGESDEVSIAVEDSGGLWRGDWYPDKKSKLDVKFGYIGRLVPAGVFQIDEIKYSGPPDAITIGALATGIKAAIRTKKSTAHEDKTLRQIAQFIADAHGFTVAGTIEDILLKRATQNKETDLAFLQRISSEYGHAFSIRDNVITFTLLYDLENAEPVDTIEKGDAVKAYDFTDTSNKTFKSASVKHQKPNSKTIVEGSADMEFINDGMGGEDSEDVLEIRTRAETPAQAKAKAKAALRRENKRGVTGSITIEGNPFCLAGNNITLTGFGFYSGVWHIEKSTHTISKGDGYTTTLELARIKKIAKSKSVLKKPATAPDSGKFIFS